MGRGLGLVLSVCVAWLPGCDSERVRAGGGSAAPVASPTGSGASWPAVPASVRLGIDAGQSELRISLRPRLQPQRGVSVIVSLAGASVAGLAAFSATPQWAGTRGPRAVHDLVIVDARGSIGLKPDDATGRYALGRGPVGGLVRASYFAATQEESNRFDLTVTAAGMWGVGHSFLVLPELDEQVAVRLQWDLTVFGTATGAASYGVGSEVVTRARPAELAHSVYLAGSVLVQEGGFGERLIMLGQPQFEASEALRFCGDTLHAARQVFEPQDRRPFTFAFLPQPHVGAEHDGAALHQSFAVWFDETRELDARLKLLVAHEVTHRWVGGKLRLSWPDGRDATWFSEGFSAHYARSLLHRAGMLSGPEFAEDLNRSYDVQRRAFSHGELGPGSRPRTSDAGVDPAAAGAGDVGAPHRASVASHRGSLYAARVDALLRRKRGGSLDETMVRLMRRAKSLPQHVLPISAWREMLAERLGPSAEQEFDRMLVKSDEPIDVPFDAFGPCFVRTVAKDARYELGFDPASLKADPRVVRGVVAGSAAEAAGLSNGDVVLSGHDTVRPGDPNHTITLVVSGERGTRLLRFSPQSTRPRVSWHWVPTCGR